MNFTHATKFQAEGIFKCFFPFKAASAATSSSDTSQQNLPLPKRKYNAIPLLEEAEINELAKHFADAIPEDELSVGSITSYDQIVFTRSLQVASLQGYLLRNKTRPRECVEEVGEWYVCSPSALR